MSCKRIEKLWPRYLSGDLEGTRRRRFEEHLAGCDDCRARREALESSRSLVLSHLPGIVNPNDIERARLRSPVTALTRPRQRFAPALAVLGAAAVAAGVAAFFYLVPPGTSPDGLADGGTAVATADDPGRSDRYELRMNTSDPKVKIVWVFDRNLKI